MERPQNLRPSELAQLDRLRAAISPSQSSLSLAQLVTLLTIALEPGLSINELAERIGAPQQTASRHASVLLGRYQDPSTPGERHAALITQSVSSNDPRSRALFLSAAGWEFIFRILAALRARG